MKKYITKKEKHANTIPADYFLQFFFNYYRYINRINANYLFKFLDLMAFPVQRNQDFSAIYE